MLLHWSEKLHATGHSEIDQQHQELFKRINGLLDAVDMGKESPHVITAIDFLGDYIVDHMQFEEQIMWQANCPAETPNKMAHSNFMQEFAELKDRLERESPEQVFDQKTKDWIVDWWNNHVMKVDTKLKNAIMLSN